MRWCAWYATVQEPQPSTSVPRRGILSWAAVDFNVEVVTRIYSLLRTILRSLSPILRLSLIFLGLLSSSLRSSGLSLLGVASLLLVVLTEVLLCHIYGCLVQALL